MKTYVQGIYGVEDTAVRTVYTWIVKGEVCAYARICIYQPARSLTESFLLEWQDIAEMMPTYMTHARPQPMPLSLRAQPIDLVGLLEGQRNRLERVYLIDVLYIGHPRRVAVICKLHDTLADLVTRFGLQEVCQLKHNNCVLIYEADEGGRTWQMTEIVDMPHASHSNFASDIHSMRTAMFPR